MYMAIIEVCAFDAVINKFLFEANFHGKSTFTATGTTPTFCYLLTPWQPCMNTGIFEDSGNSYNLVEAQLQHNDIAEVLKTYPELK